MVVVVIVVELAASLGLPLHTFARPSNPSPSPPLFSSLATCTTLRFQSNAQFQPGMSQFRRLPSNNATSLGMVHVQSPKNIKTSYMHASVRAVRPRLRSRETQVSVWNSNSRETIMSSIWEASSWLAAHFSR